MKKQKIIVDIERMKYPFTGLHNYCENLYKSLVGLKSNDFEFHFFSHSSVNLPKTINRMNRKLWEKIYLKKAKKYKLWHITYQDSKFVPKGNIKIVYTIHDLNFLYTNKTAAKKKMMLDHIQSNIKRADYITVISNFVLTDIKKHLNLYNKPVSVIYNGVTLNEFPEFNTPKYKPTKKYIFTLGTVLYKKHFHVLPQLIEGTDYELIIAGILPDKDYVTQINNESAKHHVTDRVKLVGSITEQEKYWYMKNCSAFAFPSISEGFGIPPIEAMLMGKPVFLSTFTSLPEIGGEHAYYFKSFDKKAMQDTFVNGMKDYKENNKKTAIIAWAKQFNWTKASQEYLDIYSKTLNNYQADVSEIEPLSKIKLSVIIPTLNEACNIESAIKSVNFADEIIVIDSLSKDATVAIAKKLNAKVILREFDNFSTQKNVAIEQAKNDWVYVLDADERVGEELKNEIINKITNPTDEVAFSMKMNYYFLNKIMKHGSFKTKTVIRLFNKKYCKYDGRPVHEQFNVAGKTGKLINYLDHKSNKSIDEFIQTQNFYASLKASSLLHKKDKNILLKILVKPPFRFFKHYIIQLGFLDGFRGFIFAGIQSYGVFIRYVKLWALKNVN